eukprot:TRINITY_DN10537_c0_g1_i1.p1 TRINITY_DN10537_c0_g1~~TRINITY_DN10537_c0_g1_i1.p1  ORF type:complete len:259 (-),score=55.29 TRINITY_DN10537_c0_g1_i1:25-801(-)
MSARPPPRNTCPWADDNEALDMHTKDLEAAARKREVIGKQADSLQGDGASEDVDLHTRDLEMAARKRAVLQQQGAALQKARLSLPRETAPLAYSSPRGGQDMVQVGLIMRCIEEGLSGEEMRKMLQQCSNGLLLDPGAATSPPAAFSLAAKRHADMLATPRIKPGAIDSASSRKAYLDAQSEVVKTKYKNSVGAPNLLKMESSLEQKQLATARSGMPSPQGKDERAYDSDQSRNAYVSAHTAASVTQAKNTTGPNRIF